jgi:hypothetical protein
MHNCFDNRLGWACFADGKLRKDRCYAKCFGIEKLFDCHGSRRRCRRKCRWNRF